MLVLFTIARSKIKGLRLSLEFFISANVITFAGSGESGFLDDVGLKAMMSNPQQLELDSMKRRLFLSDTVSYYTC